jgi:hypothetical protein
VTQAIDMRDVVAVLGDLIAHCEDADVTRRATALRDRMVKHAPGTNMSTNHGSLPEVVIRLALTDAFQVLEASELENPAVVLIVQADRRDGTMGRSLASTIGNPFDLLRVVLANDPNAS